MKKMMMVMAFGLIGLGLTSRASAQWVGKLDLQSSVQPLVLREARNGQWLAGLAHPNLWHLDHSGNPIFNIGFFQALNSESGNASFGPLAGVDLLGVSKEVGLDVPSTINAIGVALGVPSVFKPAVLFSQILSIDAFAGYMPTYSSDVKGPWIYGGAATLKIPFTVSELKAGL